ncbi:MAG: helix-turn-helix domain-containing protein [Actinomycetales bacterium]|nr:helix-turn-helix domain-containing protein [Actinomycetales bacterium]
MTWTTELVAAGADLAPTADGSVDVRVGRRQARYLLQRSRRSPRPGQVRPARQPTLLQVPHVSARVASLLEASGWSYATDDGAALLQFPDGYRWRLAHASGDSIPATAEARQWPVGMSRIVHALLLHEQEQPLSQTTLAALAGLTQARVSGVVRELVDDGLVSAARGRPTALDQDRLLDQWLQRRRFDPVVTYWAGDRDLALGLDEVLGQLGADILVSGDVAADASAPHRRPEQVVVLAKAGSLARAGLVPVVEQEEATVVLAVTEDPVIWAFGTEVKWRGRSIRVADRAQVLWDLDRAMGVDAEQAAAQWRRDTFRRPE